jgi:nanoRNase/pAp phosphatase (c-di-AMP/oligoRNAs hydrolase)
MLKHGGGGHENAGTCQIENDIADEVLKGLIAKINADG